MPEGGRATHLMADTSLNGKHYAYPTIHPDSPNNYKPQTFEQAYKRGEVFEFRNQRRAEKFAFGSWKKGPDRREAMREYRIYRKDQRSKDDLSKK